MKRRAGVCRVAVVLMSVAVWICAGPVSGQEQAGNIQVREELNPASSTELEAFKAKVSQAHPDMKVVKLEGDVRAVLAPVPNGVAVFVRNQSAKSALDNEVDSLRDVMASELSAGGIEVVDKADLVDSFRQWRMSQSELRAREMNLDESISGLFSGGSATEMAKMFGVRYIVLVTLGRADSRARSTADGMNVTTYNTTLLVKVLGSDGRSMFGQTYRKSYPASGVSGAGTAEVDATYYRDLFENSVIEAAEAVVASRDSWKTSDDAAVQMASFSVRTTIDGLIDGLENGVRGPVDVLDELRRVVGGVTVSLDGAVVGSSPGTFKASPGLHRLRVSRQWMRPWEQTVQIVDGAEFSIGLELSEEGMRQFTTMESFRANAAVAYAEAAWRKGIKVNFDTKEWRDVTVSGEQAGTPVSIQTTTVNTQP